MAMEHKRESRIADDWLEVDDAASVMSFSSSDELVVSPPTSPLIKSSRPADADVLSHPEEECTPAISPSPEPQHQVDSPSIGKQPDPNVSIVDKDHEPTPLPSTATATHPPPPPPDFPDPWPVDQDNIRDPNFYHKALNAAIQSIEATASKALELGASRISTLSFLKSACDELARHAKELESILANYAKRWKDGSIEVDAEDIPLNPSLLEWMSHLRMHLLNSQDEMDKIHPQDTAPDAQVLKVETIPLHVNVALAGCAEALEDALGTLEDYMPIFKTDFDEAVTRKMNIPSREIGQATPTSRREPPHPDITRLRRELYSLKDQLQAICTLLTLTCDPVIPHELPEAPQLIRSLERITESISTILTNHASEWMESGLYLPLKKTISYQEFLALEPDVLHDVAGRLGEIQADLAVEGDEWDVTYTTEILRNHRIVLLAEAGLMKELVSTVDLLESLVFPDD